MSDKLYVGWDGRKIKGAKGRKKGRNSLFSRRVLIGEFTKNAIRLNGLHASRSVVWYF